VQVLLLAVFSAASQAAPAPLSLKWNDLGGAIVQQQVVVDVVTSVEAATLPFREAESLGRA
jgi:hypothetical protein